VKLVKECCMLRGWSAIASYIIFRIDEGREGRAPKGGAPKLGREDVEFFTKACEYVERMGWEGTVALPEFQRVKWYLTLLGGGIEGGGGDLSHKNAASAAPVAKTAASSAPVAKTAASPAPVAKTAAPSAPVAKTAASPAPVAKTAASDLEKKSQGLGSRDAKLRNENKGSAYSFGSGPELKKAVGEWLGNQANAISLYGHIKFWDVSEVKDFMGLFEGATSFNEDLSRWDVSNGKSKRTMNFMLPLLTPIVQLRE
jgi:hypothetical protein